MTLPLYHNMNLVLLPVKALTQQKISMPMCPTLPQALSELHAAPTRHNISENVTRIILVQGPALPLHIRRDSIVMGHWPKYQNNMRMLPAALALLTSSSSLLLRAYLHLPLEHNIIMLLIAALRLEIPSSSLFLCIALPLSIPRRNMVL